MQWQVIGGFVGTVIVAIIGYLAVVRNARGKITDSTAADLWEESRAIRADYASRLARCDERIAQQDDRIAIIQAANDALSERNQILQRRVRELEGAV
jgi:hypothetical protein